MKRRTFLYRDKSVISVKIKESFLSILPVSLIILLLCFTIVPVESYILISFIVGTFFSVVGMGLFSLGADTSMTSIGNYVGKTVVKSKKFLIIIPVYFIVGILITIAEPDLQVLAAELSESVNKWILLIAIGVGVGVFLVIAFLRMVLKIKLKVLLLISYIAIFVLAILLKEKGLERFIPLSFDSGGVTTGPISVPFIIAIGTGVASLRSDKNASEEGFGLTALCSIGPIISVMILGLIFRPEISASNAEVLTVGNSRDLIFNIGKSFPVVFKEVSIALLPIIVVFFIVYAFGSKMSKNELIKILIGIFYTYFGLVLFLTGVNLGFMPIGKIIGESIAVKPYYLIIIPITMAIGFFVVKAEPAVHVLTAQVYEITSGAIPKKALSLSLMIGVAVAIGLSSLRIILKVNILWILIPCYLIAIVLSFIVPDIFTAVAFDSGGVASGAMTSGFILPLFLGFCSARNSDIALFGFGVVAFVAMTPLITIQILGLIYTLKKKKITLSSFKFLKRRKKKDEIID